MIQSNFEIILFTKLFTVKNSTTSISASNTKYDLMSTDRKIFAHKVVLCSRSDVMAAMFSGQFIEAQASKDRLSQVS